MRAIRAVTEAYMAISLGLLVRDHEQRAIGARGRFIGDESEKIGVLNAPSIRRAIEISAPGILTDPVSSPREFLRGNASVDAAAAVANLEALLAGRKLVRGS